MFSTPIRITQMNTRKMLSTITLFALPLVPWSIASAIEMGRPATQASTVEKPGEKPVEKAVLVRRSISVGFAENQPLHQALRDKLAASPSARFAVRDTQQVPATATGLFVSGFVSEAQPEHGFLNCRARYFVVSQPSLAAIAVESVAASVPVMQVRIFKDRPELLELATAACTAELADAIAIRLEKLPR
jgi:hypothetical protein